VLKGAGLVTERRDSNRILYSLVEDRLALSVGEFLSTVCPEQILLRGIRNRKAGSPNASGQHANTPARPALRRQRDIPHPGPVCHRRAAPAHQLSA